MTDLFWCVIKSAFFSFELETSKKRDTFKIKTTFQSLANVQFFSEIRRAVEEMHHISENEILIISMPLLWGKRSRKLEIFITAFKETQDLDKKLLLVSSQ